MVLIIGSYSEITEPGIHIYKWVPSEERFLPSTSISGIENPSYLDISEDPSIIYAITENKKNSAGALNIYEGQKGGGNLSLCNQIPFNGAGSCYISTDSARMHAFIANYGGGTLTVIQLPQENRPEAVIQQLKFGGSGPDVERQDQSHIHTAVLSKDERFLYCSDLGSDRLYQFVYDQNAHEPLRASQPPYMELPAGSGPRHLAFSPDGRRLYMVTELSGEIFVFDAEEFGAGCLQKISLLKDGYSGKMEGADIQVHSNGRFLYATNRGDANEIVVFAIDPLSGHLSFQQRINAEGLSPRSLLICEQQGLLLVANEQSDNVSIFELRSDGFLQFTGSHLQIPAPTCLKSWMKDEPVL
jgi:6-phosphogluconolactonase